VQRHIEKLLGVMLVGLLLDHWPGRYVCSVKELRGQGK